MPIISHRGAKGLAQENTVESIKIADKFRPEFIEFDVRVSKDKIPILYHDESINGKEIASLNFEEIKHLNNNIGTLDLAIRNIHYSKPLIEIKNPKDTQYIIAYNSQNSFYTSFNEHVINKLGIHKLKFFAMQRIHPFGLLDKAIKNHAVGVGINKFWILLLPYIHNRCEKNNLMIYIYTVNNRIFASLIRFFYPKVFVCTDYPNKIV